MADKAEQAFRAGYALPDVRFPDSVPEEKRVPGPHHNPFAPGQDGYDDWLDGLRERLSESAAYDPADLVKQIDAAKKEG